MKILFEFEDGTSQTVYDVSYSKINERSPQNHLIDELLSDPKAVRVYLMANDNRLVV